MPPFSMLRAKKAKSRPRTPPSPGSFYSPVRSPAPWAPRPAHPPRSCADSRHPPSAWPESRPCPTDSQALQLDLGPTFESELGEQAQTRRPSEGKGTSGEASGSKPVRPTPGPSTVHEAPRHVPAPIKIPRMHVHAPSVTIERATAGRSPSPSTKPASNPSPNSNLNLNSTPTPTTGSSTSDSVISDSAPEIVTILRAERASAIGFGLTLRPTDLGQLAGFARQDSATLPRDSYAQWSAIAPEPPLSTGAGDDPSFSTSVPPASVPTTASVSIPTPAPSTSVSPASSSKPLSKTNSPLLRRSVSTDEGLAKARPGTIYARPGAEAYALYVMDGIVEGDVPFPPSGAQEKGKEKEDVQDKGKQKEDVQAPSSPLRTRSKTLAECGPRQRSATVDIGFGTSPRTSGSGVASGSRVGSGQVHVHSVSGSNIHPFASSTGGSYAATAHVNAYAGPNIRRARSPSGATTITHPSRPITPPDAFPPDPIGKGLGVGMSTQAQVAGLALQSGSLGLSYFDPPSPLPVTESPRIRTMRLQSAPNASGPSLSSTAAASSKLSKFARSQLDSFSFLGTRGRSVSDTSSTTLPIQQRERGWTVGAPPLSPIAGEGESTPSPGPPVRPARPPSLTLQLDPPAPSSFGSVATGEEPRPLGRGNSGSSTGSGLARVGSRRLRRKRSSPRQGGARVLVSDGLERKTSVSGSHRHASSTSTGTQQPTPTSSNNSPLTSAGLALKQRRETVFPTTPRSFSNESMLESSHRSAAPEFSGFVLDGSLLMPQKSPVVSAARKAHLPIGPRLVGVPTPAAPAVAGTGVSIPAPTPGPSVVPTKPTRSQSKQAQPPSPRLQPKQPPSPAFEPIPVRWRGLTMDAAKWTFSSDQLQNIVSRAIRQSAETSSVRLLSLDVLDQELPTEVERLEQLRDVLQTKYKAQVRRRRLLMRSLTLYIDGHDPPTSRRLMDELEDVGNVCDQLAEDLYLVGDQLAQISRLRDVHSTSALAVALRKINGSYIRARSEVVELQAEKDALEAERDQAWRLAESLERELAEARQASQGESSRVSAARKSSVRQSKLSLRPSVRRSVRSSTSGASMRYHGIAFPRPPTSTHAPLAVADPANTSGEFVPPVPPVPTPGHLSTFEPSRPESISVLPASSYAQSLSPGPGGESYSVLSVPTPSATSHDLHTAQSELLKMLGLSYKEYGFRIRPRSYSDSGSPMSSPPGSPRLPLSASGPRGRLLRSTSDQALRRYSTSADRLIAVRVPATGGVPEDPAAILAALTLPQD
ncbi:hypothetical protein FRC06_003750 [Ceratobasidium sp. 370]|nr:hypothetical protein FRC06_003750 [Ceratobasidium sp. 370]